MTASSSPLTPEEARQQLADALNKIEDKINVPKRAARATSRLKSKFQTTIKEKPAVAGAGIVGVVTAVGLGILAGVSALTKR